MAQELFELQPVVSPHAKGEVKPTNEKKVEANAENDEKRPKCLKEKLLAIQTELKVPKTQYNKFGEFYYRSAEDIIEAVKPSLLKYRCLLLLTDTVEVIGNRYYVTAKASLVDIESDDVISTQSSAREEDTKKGMDGAQISGASSSYARKYALNALFLLDDVKDADFTNKYGKEETEAKHEAQPQQQQKQQPIQQLQQQLNLQHANETDKPWLDEKTFRQACEDIKAGDLKTIDRLKESYRIRNSYFNEMKELIEFQKKLSKQEPNF